MHLASFEVVSQCMGNLSGATYREENVRDVHGDKNANTDIGELLRTVNK